MCESGPFSFLCICIADMIEEETTKKHNVIECHGMSLKRKAREGDEDEERQKKKCFGCIILFATHKTSHLQISLGIRAMQLQQQVDASLVLRIRSKQRRKKEKKKRKRKKHSEKFRIKIKKEIE